MRRYDPNKHTEKSLNFPVTNCSISFEKSSVLIKHFKVATVTKYLSLLLQAILYIQIVLCGGNQKGNSVFNYSLFSKFLYDLWHSIFNSIFTLLIVLNFSFYSTFNVPGCTIVNPRFIQGVNSTFCPVAYCTILVIHLQNVRTDTPFKTFFQKRHFSTLCYISAALSLLSLQLIKVTVYLMRVNLFSLIFLHYLKK